MASSSKSLVGVLISDVLVVVRPDPLLTVSVLLTVGLEDSLEGADSFATVDGPCAEVAIDMAGGTVVNSSDST